MIMNNLYHSGVPGQKWGVRRYQNEDGTLTNEGRQHYGIGDTIRSVQEKNQAQYRVQRNLGHGRVRSFIESRTPIGLIASAKRAQQKRAETIARKKAEREAALEKDKPIAVPVLKKDDPVRKREAKAVKKTASSHIEANASTKVGKMYANQYKMARNRGSGVLSSFIQSATPIGLITSYRRAQQKRRETLAAKRKANS